MATCELCGKEFRTTQGLRGHKTFKHGHHARHNESGGLKRNSINKADERLDRLAKDIKNITEILEDLKGNLYYLQARMASVAFRDEIKHIALEVDQLRNQVKKHDQWFNPQGLHEAVIGLTGGPIADIEKRLRSHK